jgi:mono/diheme cytochrome c family protein
LAIGIGANFVVAATGATAQGLKPDPARGRELAQRLCSNCHDVGNGSATARIEPPSFRSIAARPGQTAEGLAGKIIVPHPEMPTVPITLAEIRDIVGYIESLK